MKIKEFVNSNCLGNSRVKFVVYLQTNPFVEEPYDEEKYGDLEVDNWNTWIEIVDKEHNAYIITITIAPKLEDWCKMKTETLVSTEKVKDI